MFESGHRLGEFEIVRPLGSGGMGAVYLARQLSTGQTRALKTMHPQLALRPEMFDRFVAEAQAASRIASEHVVQVIAAGFDAATSTPWLAMELLEGASLDEKITSGGPQSKEEVLGLFEQLCHGLGAAHAAGIIHRDLKPENIFVATSKRVGATAMVKILDFGIAKWTQDATAQGSQAIGSPFWLAPEQTSRGARIGPHTDIWPLGLIAFFCLTGRPYWRTAQPGVEATMQQFLGELLVEGIEPPSVRAAELGLAVLPPSFDAWFLRCVAREPAGRFATIESCLADLKIALAAEGSAAIPATAVIAPSAAPSSRARSAPVSRNRGLVIAGALAALGIVSLLGVIALIALFGSERSAAIPHAADDGSDDPLELPVVRPAEIVRLDIAQPGEPPIRLERRGVSEWMMLEPVQSPADNVAAEAAAERLSALEPIRVLTRSAEEFGDFELDPEHALHVVASGSGGPLIEIWIGRTEHGHTSLRVGARDTAILVRGTIRYAFAKSVEDFRAAAITSILPSSIEYLQIDNTHGVFSFARRSETWAPVGRAAPENFDPSVVRSLVNTFCSLRADGFAPPDATASSLGFEPRPRALVRLSGPDGETSLELGSRVVGGGAYVRRVGDATFYSVSAYAESRFDVRDESFVRRTNEVPPELMDSIRESLRGTSSGTAPVPSRRAPEE